MIGERSTSVLQAGFLELAGIARALHGDWSRPVPGYEGWTCHDLLAHVSSSAASLASIANSATDSPRPDAPPFDPDRWNRSQVRKRAESDPQDLVDEIEAGTTSLVDVLTDLPLDRPVTIGTYAGRPLGEAISEMLQHQRRHVDDLRRALHAPQET